MSKNNKILKIIGWMSFITVFILCFLLGVFISDLSAGFQDDRNDKLFWVLEAPDKQLKQIIKYREAWIFGPHDIIMYYQKRFAPKEHQLFETTLYNDGANIFPENNCKVEWEKNKARIIFLGQDQKPEEFLISFNGKVYVKQL